MSAGIEKPVDIVLSIEGAEWHGMADQVETIDNTTIAPLLFPIVEGKISVEVEGKAVPLGFHKALVADLRGRKDLVNTENEFVPLHVPKNGYKPIENKAVWDALSESLKEIDAKVSCAGTLNAGKKFFVSVDLEGYNEAIINGDKFRSYLNFITSHDGTLAFSTSDSHVRCCCQNTVRAALDNVGDFCLKVYHTSRSEALIQNMPSLVNEVLKQRLLFKENMEKMESIYISSQDAELFFTGFLNLDKDIDSLSSRTSNATGELFSLFLRGIGNKGKTLYDMFNAATQFWTSGSGTGKKSSRLEKAYKSSFGLANTKKVKIKEILLDEKARLSVVELGKKIVTFK